MIMSSKKEIVQLSIVVTTFNDSSSIVPFLKNIDAQTMAPSELLIVDGGSTDDTVDKINQYNEKSKLNILVFSDGQRRNISEGLNQGIRKAGVPWILILGTGNYYDKNYIAALLSARLSSDSLVFYSNVLGLDTSRFAKTFNEYFLNGNKPFDWEPSNHGVLISKNVFERHGLFCENFYYAGEDSEFFRRISGVGVFCEYVNTTSVYWETPNHWSEFLKKMKVNAIADWQMHPHRYVLSKIFSPLLLFLAITAMVTFSTYAGVVLLALILIIAIKKRTKNLFAILLGLTSKYIMVYYYVRSSKFAKAKWAVTGTHPSIR